MSLDLTPVLVAAVAGVPATVAAWTAAKNHRKIDTKNGSTLGELVASLDRRLKRVELAMNGRNGSRPQDTREDDMTNYDEELGDIDRT